MSEHDDNAITTRSESSNLDDSSSNASTVTAESLVDECGGSVSETVSAPGAEDVCYICASMPCEWIEFGPRVLDGAKEMFFTTDEGKKLDVNGVEVDNANMRKAVYRYFTYLKFGHLGKGTRIPIPNCVLEKIREAYPNPSGEYMGFTASSHPDEDS